MTQLHGLAWFSRLLLLNLRSRLHQQNSGYCWTIRAVRSDFNRSVRHSFVVKHMINMTEFDKRFHYRDRWKPLTTRLVTLPEFFIQSINLGNSRGSTWDITRRISFLASEQFIVEGTWISIPLNKTPAFLTQYTEWRHGASNQARTKARGCFKGPLIHSVTGWTFIWSYYAFLCKRWHHDRATFTCMTLSW